VEKVKVPGVVTQNGCSSSGALLPTTLSRPVVSPMTSPPQTMASCGGGEGEGGGGAGGGGEGDGGGGDGGGGGGSGGGGHGGGDGDGGGGGEGDGGGGGGDGGGGCAAFVQICSTRPASMPSIAFASLRCQ
jgi:hypothetical protein